MAAPKCDSMDSKGMQFAKQQLEKFGWKEGSGLGRNNTGITAALKPKLKFDAAGLGHKQSEELLYEWWNHAYNKAAQSFDVETTNDGGTVIQNSSVGKISNKKQVTTDNSRKHSYGSFHKAGTLTSGKLVESEHSAPAVTEEKEYFIKLSDEELFRRCGGRTAHKGARHGHRCKGKLARVAEQEALLLAKLQQTANQDEEKKEPEMEKKKKKKKKTVDEIEKISDEEIIGCKENEELKMEKKKSKKKNESIALPNDTVTLTVAEIPEDEGSCIVSEKKKKKRKHQESEENFHCDEEHINVLKNKKKKKKEKEMKPLERDSVKSLPEETEVEQLPDAKKRKKRKNKTEE